MRSSIWITTAITCMALIGACKKEESQQAAVAPTATAPYGYGQPGYPQQPGQPGYPQQPGQPAPGYPGAAPTTPAPGGTVPAAAPGQMAVPGPLAFPCQNDSSCGLHHCNTQYGKCAFPCQSEVDCVQGNQCFTGLCVPKAPGQQQVK